MADHFLENIPIPCYNKLSYCLYENISSRIGNAHPNFYTRKKTFQGKEAQYEAN